jgi:hypothetical protein
VNPWVLAVIIIAAWAVAALAVVAFVESGTRRKPPRMR